MSSSASGFASSNSSAGDVLACPSWPPSNKTSLAMDAGRVRLRRGDQNSLSSHSCSDSFS